MNMENPTVNAFYDSDEDVSWGPVSLRELKRDLKSKNKLNPNYRRQTAAFVPLPSENNLKMYTPNSSHSSKYFTANESLESNIRPTHRLPEAVTNDNSHNDSCGIRSDKFVSIDTDSIDTMEPSGVIMLSSDSEDDYEIPESVHVKSERISSDHRSKHNSSIVEDNIISLSSSDEEDPYEEVNTSHPKDINSGSALSYSNHLAINKDSSLACELKESLTCSHSGKDYIIELSNTSKDLINVSQNEDESDRDVENALNHSNPAPTNNDSSFVYEINESPPHSNNRGDTETSHKLSSEQINISQNENEYEYCEEKNHTLQQQELDQSLRFSILLDNSHDSVTSDKVNDWNKSNSAQGASKMQENSVHNAAASDEVDDWNKSNNHRADSEMQEKPAYNDSVTSDEVAVLIESNNLQAYSKMQESSVYSDSVTSDRVDDWNKSNNLQEDSKTQESSVDGISEDLGNFSLNDTFAEMERFLNEDYDSESDDSGDNVIESTPNKSAAPAFENSVMKHISKIPVPNSSDESINSSSSRKFDFKVPKYPVKCTKKTPSKLLPPKTSPLPLKNIVSPVRLYIKNSPYPTLKQSYKPDCSRSQKMLFGSSEICTVAPKMHRNLLDSLPEVVYKPSKHVEQKCENQIILPKNIRSLITKRVVIKHEPRQRIVHDESIFSTEEKLTMRDLTHMVSDDHNMSVHTVKQGFNL